MRRGFSQPLFWVLFIGLAFGQGDQSLTLAQCLEESARANPDVLTALENIRVAEARVRGSLSGYFPNFSASGGAGFSTNALSSPTLSATLTVSEEVWGGLQTAASVRQAKAQLDGAKADGRTARLSADLATRGAFHQLIYAQENLTLSRATAQRREENSKLVALRFDSGRENLGARNRSEAQWIEAVMEASNAMRDQITSQMELALAMGRPPLAPLKVTGEITPVSEGAPDFPALARSTPEYEKARAALASSRAGEMSARGAFSPTLRADGSYSLRSSGTTTENWSASLNASWAFATGLQEVWNLQGAEGVTRNALRALKQKEGSITAALAKAYHAHLAAQDQVAVRQKYLEASETQAEIARTQYASGLISYTDWDTIENALIADRKAMLAAHNKAGQARAAWVYAKGSPE